MQKKMKSLIDYQTWELIRKEKVEPEHCPFKEKWVYHIKRRVDNQITQFKVRWVVKDYLQPVRLDFDQIFAAIIKLMIFKRYLLLRYSMTYTYNGWISKQHLFME